MDFGGPEENRRPEQKPHELGTVLGPFRRLPKPTARVQQPLVKGASKTKQLSTPVFQVLEVEGERKEDGPSTRNVLASRDPNVSTSIAERRSLSTQPRSHEAHNDDGIRKMKNTQFFPGGRPLDLPIFQPSVAPRDANPEPASRASRKRTFESADLTTDEDPVFVQITEDQARELKGLPPRKKTFVMLDGSQKDQDDNADDTDHIGTTNSVTDIISNDPQFHQLREAISSQPQILEPVLRQIETSNPVLARAIHDHGQEFQRLLYEGVDPAAARKVARWFKKNWVE